MVCRVWDKASTDGSYLSRQLLRVLVPPEPAIAPIRCQATVPAIARFTRTPWQEGPDIDGLVDDFHGSGYGVHVLEMDLVFTFRDHYTHNEMSVSRVTFFVTLQGLVAFAGASSLFGALLGIA